MRNGRRADGVAPKLSTRAGLVGRAELLARVRSRLSAGHSVLLWGPAGIGKSALLDALVGEFSGAVVLRSTTSGAVTELPYLTLLDLFGGVPAAALDVLPAHLRAALDAALLRGGFPAARCDQLAVRMAVLELLRALVARRPVLIVVDDAQWMDAPSTDVLQFAMLRLAGTAVRLVMAEQSTERMGDAGRSRRCCPDPCTEVRVPPLAEPDVASVLRARLGPSLSRRDIQRVYRASGGNPLHAVELGRALAELPVPAPATEPLPVPGRLAGLLADRLSTLPQDAAAALLLVAAAARPSVALLERCEVAAGPLAAAERCGVVAIGPDGAIRFTHPLLREMVYADATADARRGAHQRLAMAAGDPVEAAQHLAAACSGPDEGLAGALSAAASAARLRGAPATAGDLARLAAERTPPGEPGVAAARWLAAARYVAEAGATDEARGHATVALRRAGDARTRVGARLLLAELVGEERPARGSLLETALGEASDCPDLLTRVRLRRAIDAHAEGDVEAAYAEFKRAEASAARCGDPERLVEVLSRRGTMLAGTQGDDELERAWALAAGLPLTPTVVETRRLAALGRLFRGEVTEALRRVTALRDAVERSGTVRDLAAVLCSVAVVYLRAGRCTEALTAGRECARLFLDVMPAPGPGLVVGATTELTGGSLARAADQAERALAACLEAGDDDWTRLAYVTRGRIDAARDDPLAAIVSMRRAYVLERRLDRADPGRVLWHADFVEALAGAGAREEAAEVLADATARAERYGRHVALLGLARARALLTAANGRPGEAARALSAMIERSTGHPYPLETARAYHVLGVLELRVQRRGAARAAFAEAVTRFGAARAVPWRDAAARELARLDGGRGPGLSETERRIVDLVRAGATNREIGRTMFLSVKAVEANLTRLYRRLNVSNRSQLAAMLEEAE